MQRGVDKLVDLATSYGVSASLLGSWLDDLPSQQVARTVADERRLYHVLEQLVVEYGATDFAVRAAEHVSVDDFGVLGFAARTSATLGEALDRFARYHQIWAGVRTLDVDDAASALRITLRAAPANSVGTRVARELDMGQLVAFIREVVPPGAPLQWHRVQMAHPVPNPVEAHEAFFGPSLCWDQPTYTVVLGAEAASLALAMSNDAMAQHFEAQLRELEARYQPASDPLVRRVSSQIARSLPSGPPTLAQVARRLGIGERTLRRQLTERHTNFSRVRDETRLHIARELLRDPDQPVAEVAYCTGFSEPSAFHRAFKRWTGETPGEFRGRHGR